MPRILIVDDEEPLRASLSFSFAREGFLVSTARDGPSAVERALAEQPEVVLLDLNLPGLDGMEVCRRVRERLDCAVIMLTARDQPADRVAGLECGADDYVTKPFNGRELLARVRATSRRRSGALRLVEEDRALLDRIVRRHRGGERHHDDAVSPVPVLRWGALVLDTGQLSLQCRSNVHSVTREEAEILRGLLEAHGAVVTRTQLLARIGRTTSAEDLAHLRALVRRLRELVEQDPSSPASILTIPGIGYQTGAPP